jgi:hypothetical protein
VTQTRPDLTDARTVFIYDTVLIENAIGGGGNDQLIGNYAATAYPVAAEAISYLAVLVTTRWTVGPALIQSPI